MEKLNCSYIYIGFLLVIISSLHCFSMCGPITFFLLKNNLNSQIGRIIYYILLGYIFGTIGYRFNRSI
ncbi:urease accessory protein UreH domain-containing protein [Candidatus Karelsulcia muelleri]|uniref:urease accessory protein UreH domain-containing protein n=1 Tax=Candidatus Karelsulcia muelleri TaxID=336810 RepID=UPI000D7CC961